MPDILLSLRGMRSEGDFPFPPSCKLVPESFTPGNVVFWGPTITRNSMRNVWRQAGEGFADTAATHLQTTILRKGICAWEMDKNIWLFYKTQERHRIDPNLGELAHKKIKQILPELPCAEQVVESGGKWCIFKGTADEFYIFFAQRIGQWEQKISCQPIKAAN